ncbi:MAG: hypothetical protein ABIL58_29445 [Pseudomonadota bacterium]
MTWKFRKRMPRPDREQSGAFIQVDPTTGRIDGIYIISPDDQAQAVIAGTLARITRPGAWGWVQRLFR